MFFMTISEGMTRREGLIRLEKCQFLTILYWADVMIYPKYGWIGQNTNIIVLDMTKFVLNRTGLVHSVIKFGQSRTGFCLGKRGFVIFMSKISAEICSVLVS